ncbi:MAG: metallophosphoesterase [Acidaminococcales bacterium]|nr:metallophosphoesterase [Acidaminococcales bacterium]
MRGPGFFTTIALGLAFFIAFANCMLGMRVLRLPAKKGAVFVFLLFNAAAAWGATLAWTKALPGAEFISRFCVFWFVGQIILLPFFLFGGAATFAAGPAAAGAIKAGGAAALVFAFAVSGYGAFYESVTVTTSRRELILPNLDPEADGFKIAHLTDLHLGMFFSLADLRSVLEQARAENPDAMAITGDLIDDASQAADMAAVLDEFAGCFPYGIYYVWGNHEYMRGERTVAESLAKSKTVVLKNASARLLGTASPLYMLGVDYSFARDPDARSREYGRMLKAALEGVPREATKILLSHHSAAIDEAFAQGIDLTLAGHTHGTQVGLFGRPLYREAFKYIRGVYGKGGLYGYVSTGVSGWFPFRFGCPPEIAVFTLKSK